MTLAVSKLNGFFVYTLKLPIIIGAMMKNVRFAGVVLGLVCFSSSSWAVMSDAELIKMRDGFEARRDAMLGKLAGQPFKPAKKRPPLAPGRAAYTRHYTYSVTDFAMKAFLLNEQLDTANAAIKENCEYYIGSRGARNDRDSFYWAADVVCRLVEFFGKKGSLFPGRLTEQTEAVVHEMMWLYCQDNSKVEDAETARSQTWHVRESENHHLQHFSTCWQFSKFLKDDPRYNQRKYDDGKTPQEHFDAWTRYIKEYLRERAKKGLFVETANKGYGFITLKGIYNFYDFADDATLKGRAGDLLDLYWASWAQEQLAGVRGGGQSRVYQGPMSQQRGNDQIGAAVWYYLGVGEGAPPRGNTFSVITSSYRMPLVVMDMALDAKGRGVYETKQRRMGLVYAGYHTPPDYRLRTDFGGIYRYTWCTPEFIIGTAMFEARPFEDWSMISSQNRWHGVIFDGHVDARIFPQCQSTTGRVTYNQQWAVQQKGTLIAQKLPGKKYSREAGDMRVWFAENGLSNRVEEDGWVFVEAAGAYAAVRPVMGNYRWQKDEKDGPGDWLRCEHELTPVIIEVARKVDFADYQAFRKAVLSLPMKFKKKVLTYQGLSGDEFTFYADYSANPKVNGKTVNYAPEKVFDSPFIQSQWNSGVVTISKGSRKLTLDFNKEH